MRRPFRRSADVRGRFAFFDDVSRDAGFRGVRPRARGAPAPLRVDPDGRRYFDCRERSGVHKRSAGAPRTRDARSRSRLRAVP